MSCVACGIPHVPLVLVEDWDAIERLWSYAFGNHLRVQETAHPVMIAEPTINTMDRREKVRTDIWMGETCAWDDYKMDLQVDAM